MGSNTFAISISAPFQYLLNTSEVGTLEKLSFIIHKILRLFVNTFTADDKDYLLNRDNFAQRIEMQLSQKQKTFSELFFAYLKSKFNFTQFPKKDDPHK